MKLTLSVSGGFTGLMRQHSIEADSLSAEIRHALVSYVNSGPHPAPKSGVAETWTLDAKEVSIVRHKLPDTLKKLYDEMKKNLQYNKR